MKIIFFLIFFIFNTILNAQEYQLEKILNPKNPDHFKPTVSEVYQGTPIVKMEGKFKQKSGPRLSTATQKELSEKELPLNLIYNIKTPFGVSQTAGNIDHTTDFYTKIQIIDNKNVLIDENIQFVTTTPRKIERIIPLSFNDIENTEAMKLNVLAFEINGKSLNYNIEQTKNSFQIQSTKEFPAGVHLINFKYILENAIQNSNSLNRLFISTTGDKWPFPIHRFRAIVLYPASFIHYQNDMLFGNNNILINDNVKVTKDIKGNTLYITTRPLPAFADIRILEVFDGKNLPISFSDSFVEKNLSVLLSFGTFICLSFYLFISSVLLKKMGKRQETILKKVNSLPVCVLMYLNKKNFSPDIFSDLKRIEKTVKKSKLRTKILRVLFKIKGINILMNYLLKFNAIIYLTGKYILTGALLFFIIMNPVILGYETKYNWLIFVVISSYFIELIIFFQRKIKPMYIEDIQVFKEKILNPYLCFGLKNKTILNFYKRYYKTTYILDIQDKFKMLIEKQTKNFSLPTIKNRDK